MTSGAIITQVFLHDKCGDSIPVLQSVTINSIPVLQSVTIIGRSQLAMAGAVSVDKNKAAPGGALVLNRVSAVAGAVTIIT